MKILVCIASFGTKNDRYLAILINEYQSMRHAVDVIVLSNVPKTLGKSIEVIVGLPSQNPWSLPFAHKSVFAERVDDYDLFIYTENDILIKESNIEAFFRLTRILPENKIAGFMLYEDDPLNLKNHVDVHGGYHWDPKSVETIGPYTFAHFTNEHSACYLLTRDQLKKAIDSGGYLTPPREGKYDMLCTAATDPYTQCGFKKVICISHFDDFALHHLPNAYVGKFGISEREFRKQLDALLEIAQGKRTRSEFLQSAAVSAGRRKRYYDPCNDNVLQLVPAGTKNVLSVGCGSADTEARLVKRGIECAAVPLDSVIGTVAEMKGVHTLSPDLETALHSIAGRQFDCILVLNVLQHIDDLSDFLTKCRRFLSRKGVMIGTVPTVDYINDLLPKRYRTGTGSDRVKYYLPYDILSGGFKIIRRKVSDWLNRRPRPDVTNKRELLRCLKRNGIEVTRIDYQTDGLSEKRQRMTFGPLKSIFADKLIFTGRDNEAIPSIFRLGGKMDGIRTVN